MLALAGLSTWWLLHYIVALLRISTRFVLTPLPQVEWACLIPMSLHSDIHPGFAFFSFSFSFLFGQLGNTANHPLKN